MEGEDGCVEVIKVNLTLVGCNGWAEVDWKDCSMVRAQTALLVDPGLIPRAHKSAHIFHNSRPREFNTSFWTLGATQTYMHKVTQNGKNFKKNTLSKATYGERFACRTVLCCRSLLWGSQANRDLKWPSQSRE